MEALIFLLIIYGIFNVATKKFGNKAAQGTDAERTRRVGTEEMSARMQGSGARAQDERQNRQRHREGSPSMEGAGTLGRNAGSGYQPITHRMEDVKPMSEYAGSLGASSTEGVDLCDPMLQHARVRKPVADGVYADEIGGVPLVDTSARGILQGVVMSEILTRPSQRKWGRR